MVRSARRLYVAAVANGQTTIFALAADGSKIAAIEVTVGRDIGELQELLNVALPGNDITVKTVAEFDHPDGLGRLGRRSAEGARHRQRLRRHLGAGRRLERPPGGPDRRRRVDASQRRAIGTPR